ncbi:MAG: outer membrane beta-barrel protein [Draconibacterium sp.]
MKKSILLVIVILSSVSLFAQPFFDLGIKGGANFSKISLNLDDYSSESVVKTHFGAFSRIGWDRIFIQPEVYFSGKGGDLKSSALSTITSFDYKTVDVPVLLGLRIIKGKAIDIHAVGGPVFSKITKTDVKGDAVFNEDFYKNHYFGIQYGLGIDVLFLTFDARMENAFDEFYSQSGSGGKNSTFMLSVGFKFL